MMIPRLTLLVLAFLLVACSPAAADELIISPAAPDNETVVESSAENSPAPSKTIPSTLTPTLTPVPTAEPRPVTFVGAGDIGECGLDSDDQTAALILSMIAEDPETVVYTLGDNAYEEGTLAQFQQCYDHSWGQFKDRTRPSAGNHEYKTTGAAGYFEYFGTNAGEPGKGYYSYTVNGWQIIVLNSNCGWVGCSAESEQVQWLKAELQINLAEQDNSGAPGCTIAYMHHPRWSSGPANDIYWIGAFWDALYEAGAEIALGGHDHLYERFSPQDPSGAIDLERGIRQFVVGTGGSNNYPFTEVDANSESRFSDVHGVLKLSLLPGEYSWQFINVDGNVLDSGTGLCHE